MGEVGVLALQGGFAAHARALERLGHRAVEVRGPRDLRALSGLVLPGGESTVMLKLVGRAEMGPALDAFVRSGAPVLATCAGLILASRRVTNPEQPSFGWLDVDVARNAWGRQLDSAEARSDAGLPLVLIRAPRVTRAGPRVETLETLGGEPVLVREGAVWGATFHPELTDDAAVHAAVFGRGREEAERGSAGYPADPCSTSSVYSSGWRSGRAHGGESPRGWRDGSRSRRPSPWPC